MFLLVRPCGCPSVNRRQLASFSQLAPRTACADRGKNARFKCKAYTSSDSEEDAQHFQVLADPPQPTGNTSRAPWTKGGIGLAMAALILASFAWYTRSKRKQRVQEADQHSTRHEVPASEADLDNTVRSLTQQRLSDSLATWALQGVSVRQPAQCCWQPHGVGSVYCKTSVRYYEGGPLTADIVSGPATVELLKLQVEYLVFLKQSDSMQALNPKPRKYIKL